MPSTGSQSPPSSEPSSARETVLSFVMAFVMAFVFRGFVVEPFMIPTGSMAPTLLGQHIRFSSPSSGRSWPVGPFFYYPRPSAEVPLDFQPALAPSPDGRGDYPLAVNDPNNKERIASPRGEALRSGDRVFVMKYTPLLFEPRRFDVIVFKNPQLASMNFIKRLVGLPGEEIALVDGDVFTRPAGSAGGWEAPDWRIARKAGHVQQALWQGVFDSSQAPLNTAGFAPPWKAASGAWEGLASPRWRLTGEHGTLRWDPPGGELDYAQLDSPYRAPDQEVWDAVYGRWHLSDAAPYNQGPRTHPPRTSIFPVSDVRLTATLIPDSSGLSFTARLAARGHVFEAIVKDGQALLRWRPAGDPQAPWSTLAQAPAPSLAPGVPVSLRFTHADQALSLSIDDREIAHGEYDWSPAQRVEMATGQRLEQIVIRHDRVNPLTDPTLYRPPHLELELSGSPATLTRLALDRDLYYQPAARRDAPATGTHPAAALRLGEGQYFCCGDNSAASLDGRLWESVDPWVAHEVGGEMGVVDRRLIVGRAFFVYFPGLARGGSFKSFPGLPVPDFGRMRWIW